MSNKENIGTCSCCGEIIEHDQLYVTENNITYHLSCYNVLKHLEGKSDNK